MPNVNPTATVKVNPFAEPGQTINYLGQVEYSPCNPHVAGILSFLFGVIGLHDFYCGNVSSGVIKLILSITGIATIVSMVWNLMDLYSIGDGSYVDGDGLSLEPAPWAKVIVILELLLMVGLGFLVFMLLTMLFG
jgi:hypothetical protein